MISDNELALVLKQIDAQLEPETYVTKTFTTLELLALKHFTKELVETAGDTSLDVDTPQNRIFNFALSILKDKFYNGE